VEIDGKLDLNDGSGSVFIGTDAGSANTTGNNNTATGYRTLYTNTTGMRNTAIGSMALYNNETGYQNTANGFQALYNNTTAYWNTAIGDRALYSNTTGVLNTATGNFALNSNTTGNFNTATGVSALYSNTTGSNNTATGVSALYSNTTGYFNTATGYEALSSNTTGNNNTATGYTALYDNTTGYNNTATGYEALRFNTTGFNNTANGFRALRANTTGYENTANGYEALRSNTTGWRNTANGVQALYNNTTGYFNTANGYQALYSNTTGSNNTANGMQALLNNTTGNYNTATGYQALFNNTTGTENTAIGHRALRNNTTGNRNTATGFEALHLNTTGTQNTATGYYALRGNTTGSNNIATGYYALFSNTTGGANIATGLQALFSNTTGNNNTANGYLALFSNTTGNSNTANGFLALGNNTIGNQNTATGYQAGRYTGSSDANTNSDNSIFIGYNTRPQLDSQSNQIVIGDQAIGNGSNSITIGNSNHDKTYIEGIYDATTNNSSNVYITSDGQLKRSLTSVSVFDSIYSVADSIIFITPNDTFNVSFEVQTDDWGTQVVVSDSTLDGNGTTGSILKLAKQDATDGQVLKWNDALMTWKPADDLDEQDIDGLTFDTLTGSLTVGITNGTSQTIDLDGRYLESEVDGSTTNELQNLSLVGDSINISNGTGIDISAYLDNTDTDSILVDSLGTILVKNRGDVITLIPNTDDQQIDKFELTGTDLKLSIEDDGQADQTVSFAGWDTDASDDFSGSWNDLTDIPAGFADNIDNVNDADSSATNELQTLSWSAGTNGNDEITLSNGGLTVTITDDVNDADADTTNEIQNLSIDSSGRVFTISIENGNSVSFEDQVDDADASATNEAWTIRDDAANTDLISNGTVFFNGVGNISTSLSEPSPGFFTLDISSSDTSELQTLNAGDYMQITGDGINTPWEATFDVNSSSYATHVLLSNQGNEVVKYPNSIYTMSPDQILVYDTIVGSTLGWKPINISSVNTDDQQLGWTQDTGLLTLTNSSNVTIDVYDGITRGLVPDSIDVVRPDDYYLNMDGTWKVPVDNDNYVESITMLDPEDDDTWRITLNRSGVLADAIEDVDLSKYLDNTDTDSVYFRHFNIVQNITRGDTAVVSYVVSDYPDGYVHCDTNDITKIKSVTSTTGRVWMDRNLGASRAAISSTDTSAYGDLFQWGRFADGHQCRNSATTSTNATTAAPNLGNTWDGKFITESFSPYDWLTTQNDTLWQGIDGINNPCPTGYRVPTETELNNERLSWSDNNSAGAFSSPLKLPNSGGRYFSSGSPFNLGSGGAYWSSSVSASYSRYLSFTASDADLLPFFRTYGLSLRCIKDQNPTQYILDESNSNKLIAISEDNKFEYVDKRRPLYTNYTVTEGGTVTVDLRNQPHGIHNVDPTGPFTNGYTLHVSNVFSDNTNYASEYTISLFDTGNGNAVQVNLDSNYTWISQLGNAITSFQIGDDSGFRLELYTIDGNTLYTNINQ